MNPGSSLPETVAAIDLGSNSFHLIVARTKGGELVIVDRLREMVQLASGLDKNGAQALRMESLYIGCVSMSRRWFEDGEITEKRWDKARVAARQEFEPTQAVFRKLGREVAIGGAGTIRAVQAAVTAAEWSKEGITLKSLRRLRDAMLEAGHVSELGLVSAARRSVFFGGLAILFAAFEALKIDTMLQSDGALREGLLYDLLGRFGEEDVRGRSISALDDRYHVDRKQAGQVERTAQQLLGQVAKEWNLEGTEARQLLSWAAQLHEIGLDIAHASYHKHGQYIVDQSDLPGFSREEQTRLAALVRAHRRRFPVALIKSLRRRRRMTERLAILLRLAVALHRSRGPDALPDLELKPGKKSLRLDLPPEWLETHPLTRADLQSEAEYLSEIGTRLIVT